MSRSPVRNGFVLFIIASVSMVGVNRVNAQSATWNGTADNFWTNAANWSTLTTVPGTGNTATFNNGGNGNFLIDLGGGARSVGSILFDTNAVGYTFSSNAGDAFVFDAGGAITITSAVTNSQIFNTPLQLLGAIAVTNDSATGLLTLNGGISLAGGGTAGVLTIAGAGNTTINGNIAAGAITGLTKSGAGTLTLSGTNAYAGVTTVNGGVLSFSTSANLGSNVAGNSIALNGGTLSYTGATLSLGTNRAIALGAGGGSISPTVAGNVLTVNGVISGAGGLTKTGAGTLTLSGTNSYAGVTTVSGGILNFSAGANLGNNTATNSIALSNGGLLSYTANTTLALGANRGIAVGAGGGGIETPTTATIVLTVDGLLSGSGTLTKTGPSFLALTGNNSGFSGNIVSNQGNVRVSNSNGLGANSTISINNTQALAGVIGGTGNNLNLQGGVTIPGSVGLVLFSDPTGGSYRAALVSDNGTNIWNGPVTVAGTATTAQFYQTAAGQTLTINGDITAPTSSSATSINFRGGAGTTVLNGHINAPGATIARTDAGGTLLINTANNTWGNTTVALGTVRIGISDALPTTTLVTMGQGDAGTPVLDLNGFNQTIGALAFNSNTTGVKTITNGVAATQSTLTVNTSGTNIYGISSGVTPNTNLGAITGNIKLVKDGTGSLELTGGSVLSFSGGAVVTNGTLLLSGPAAFSGGATVNGGVLQTTAAANYTGGTTVNGGFLQPSGAGTIGNVNGALTVNGGTFDLNSTNQTAGLFSGTGGTVLNNGVGTATLTLGNAANGTFTGTLKDNGGVGGNFALTKVGAGTLTLAGTNTYTGATTVNAGTLKLDSAPPANTSFNIAGGATLTFNNIVGNQLTALGGLTLGSGAGASVINMRIGSVLNSDTLQTASFANSVGTTSFNFTSLAGFGANDYTLLAAAGGLLSSGANYSIGTTPGGAFGYSLITSDTSVVLHVNAIIPSSGPIFWTGGTDSKWNTTNLGNAVNFATNAAGTTGMSGTPNPTNTVIFSADNVNPGNTNTTTLETSVTINDLIFNNQTSLGAIGSIVIAPGLVPTNSLTITPTTSSTVGINMQTGAPAAITISAPLVVGATQTWTVADAASALTLSGGVTGTANVVKTGPGALVLSDFGTGFTGDLALNGGNLTVNGTLASSITGAISGSGGLTKDGTNSFTVGGANTYTGPTTLVGGTLLASTIVDGGLPSSIGASSSNAANLVFNGGGLSLSAVTSSTNRNISMAGDGTLLLPTANSTLTLNGALSGPGALTLNMQNTLVGSTSVVNLTADNSAFTGNLTINNGHVVIKNANNLGSGTKTINVAVNTTGLASLQLDGSAGDINLPSSFSFVTSSANSPLAGIFSLAGNNTIAGDISLVAGFGGSNFTVNGGSLTLSGTVTVAPGATSRPIILTGTNPGFFTGTLNDGPNGFLGVTKGTGAGTWTISGAANYGGPTTVLGGVLKSGLDNAIGLGQLVFGDTTAAVGTFDMATFNQTVGLITAQNNSTTTNTILIGAGNTLTTTAGLTIGINVGAGLPGTTSKLTISGGGDFVIASGNVQIGVSQTAANNSNDSVGTLDLSGLTGVNGFTANVTNFNVGQGNTSGGFLTLTNTANAITATTMNISNNNGSNGAQLNTYVSTVVLGTGTNTIFANTLNIGISKVAGLLTFAAQTAGSPGTVTIADQTGFGPANITIGSNNGIATAAVYTATMDLRGHMSIVNANTLSLGIGSNSNAGGSVTGVVSFDAGTFMVNTINMGAKTNGGGTATGIINQGGGDLIVNLGGSFTMASNTGGTGATNGVAATAELNITGGAFTTNVDILKGAGTLTSAKISLNGGTLDLAGHNIGGAAPIDILNFQTGTLKNVLQINNGVNGVAKNTPGTLTLAGLNSYSGPTTVDAGKLLIGVGGIGSIVSNTTVNNGGTLGGTGTSFGTVTVTTGGTVAPGSSVGTLTVMNDVTLNAGSKYEWEINGYTPAPAAANSGLSTNLTNHDQLATTGIFGATGFTLRISELGTPTFTAGNTYSWTIATGSGTPIASAVTFDLSSAPTFVALGGIPQLSLTTAAGQVNLNFTPVPEPATVLAWCAASAGVVWLRRRAKK